MVGSSPPVSECARVARAGPGSGGAVAAGVAAVGELVPQLAGGDAEPVGEGVEVPVAVGGFGELCGDQEQAREGAGLGFAVGAGEPVIEYVEGVEAHGEHE